MDFAGPRADMARPAWWSVLNQEADLGLYGLQVAGSSCPHLTLVSKGLGALHAPCFSELQLLEHPPSFFSFLSSLGSLGHIWHSGSS